MKGTPTVRHSLTAFAVLVTLCFPEIGVAQQLPGGVSVQEVQAAVSQPISVPAGQTITVDLGVPVQAQYSGDGWQVSTSGTQVTVTAPAGGGSTISVPAQAAGYSATITLVSDPVVAAPVPNTNDEGNNDSGTNDAEQPDTTSDVGNGTADSTHPAREQASPVSDTDARRIDLTATVSGNTITSQLGLLEAARLYNEFSGVDQEGLSIRYVDSTGQIIKGVKRAIDKESRTLTLTYPEGETPDNPFIIQVIRDKETAIAVVTLTDPDAPSGATVGNNEEDPTAPNKDATPGKNKEKNGGSSVTSLIGIAALAGVGVLVLLAIILTVGRKRK